MTYYLYVAGTTMPDGSPGPSKIGISKNVKKRIGSLKTGCPYKIEDCFAFKLISKIEARRCEAEMLEFLEGTYGKSAGEWITVDFQLALESVITFFQLSFREDDIIFGERNKRALEEIGVFKAISYYEDLP